MLPPLIGRQHRDAVLQVVGLGGEERRCRDQQAARELAGGLVNLATRTNRRGCGVGRVGREPLEQMVPPVRRWRNSRGGGISKTAVRVVQGQYCMGGKRVHSREERASHNVGTGFAGLDVHG